MRSLPSDSYQTSIFANLYCDADLVTKLISPEEKSRVQSRCTGNAINIIDCHCFDLDGYINDAGGLDMNSKILGGPSPYIQDDITVIPREWFDREPGTITGNIVGIRLGDILSHQPRKRAGFYRISDDVHIDLSALLRPVFRGKKVVLFATGIDVVIETIWWRRHAIDLFDSIARAGFYAVTGINFSLFLNECPLGQLLNLNKSLKFCEELSRRGVAVIPHLYAVNPNQRDKWVTFLRTNPDVRTVTINTQMQRDHLSMREVELTVQRLVAETSVNIVLNGYQLPSTTKAMDGRVYMASQNGLKQRAIFENFLVRLHQRAETQDGIFSDVNLKSLAVQ